MWIVDFVRIAAIPGQAARVILAHLIETMDKQTQIAEVDEIIQSRFPQQAISAGLIQLRDLGIIRRSVDGRGWGRLWINPAVVHPHWRKGRALTDLQDAFDQGPTGLGKKLRTQKNPQGEMPRGSAGGHMQCLLREQETT